MSNQNEVLNNREQIEGWIKEAEKRLDGEEKISVSEVWIGLRVIPDAIEFWQWREIRLHDQFKSRKDASASGGWKVETLSP